MKVIAMLILAILVCDKKIIVKKESAQSQIEPNKDTNSGNMIGMKLYGFVLTVIVTSALLALINLVISNKFACDEFDAPMTKNALLKYAIEVDFP